MSEKELERLRVKAWFYTYLRITVFWIIFATLLLLFPFLTSIAFCIFSYCIMSEQLLRELDRKNFHGTSFAHTLKADGTATTKCLNPLSKPQVLQKICYAFIRWVFAPIEVLLLLILFSIAGGAPIA